VRILILSDWAPQPGGVETTIDLVAATLRAGGDEVTLVGGGERRHAPQGDYVATISPRLPLKALQQIDNRDAVRTVRRAVAEVRPDVAYVHAFEFSLSPAAVLALGRVPFVLSIGNYKPVCPNALKLRPDGTQCATPRGSVCRRAGCLGTAHWLRDEVRYRRIEAVLAQAHTRMTCSDYMVSALASAGVEALHVPWPVLGPAAGFVRRPATEPLVVYAGRLAREKGVALLLRAFAEARSSVPRLRLRLVGEGPERGEIERLAAELGLDGAVGVSGWLDHAAVEDALADAWAVVVPSLWAEPLGLVALEAIVRGIPVVASATGGLLETAGRACPDLLFPVGSQAALAERLVAVGRASAPPGVEPAAAAALARRHDRDAHVAALRDVLAGAAA
jgi:glycosyltransferase involved in cell wall biosynthesis